MRRGLRATVMGGFALAFGAAGTQSFAQAAEENPPGLPIISSQRANALAQVKAATPPFPLISLELGRRLERAADDELIPVIVILRDQPTGPISRDTRARFQAQLDERAALLRNVTRRTLQKHQVAAPERAALQDVELRRELARQIDDLRRSTTLEIHGRAQAAAAPTQTVLTQFIQHVGGEVTATASVMNMIAASVPATGFEQLAQHPLVARIDLDQPVFAELDLQRQSLGVETTFWANGVDGGTFDCGVLDTGVQQDHPALSSHPFLSNMGASDTDPFGHGTAVTGIIASTNSTFRGIAFGLDTIVVAEASGAISVSMSGMDYIASTGEPENVNYSFGNTASPDGDYTTIDQFFDAAIDSFGFMVSKSAGNNGYHATNPTITHPSHAYNLIATANMNDQNTVARDDDRIDFTSSVGPTPGARKKPDITAPGTNTVTCTTSGNFANFSGTSSAAPHVGAGVILLMDLGVAQPMAAKAILINTADAMTDSGTQSTADDAYVSGSLWNRRYGWGYLNLSRAYEYGLDCFVDSVSSAPQDADFKMYKGPAAMFDKFTLVWQRHVAYSGASFPTQLEALSNLDLLAYRESDSNQIAASTSTIDNVEQFHVANDEPDLVVKVKAAAAFDPDIASEEFALATFGNMSAAIGSSFSATFTHPPNVQPDAVFNLSVTIANSGDLKAHAPSVQLSGLNVVNGPNPALMPSLLPGAQTKIMWTVQAPASNGQYPISLVVTSNSYGELFADAVAHDINVNNCAADVTGDAQVSVPDLLVVVNSWGPCPAPPANCNADINHDGVVNVVDLIAIINAWGNCP